jgi:hypothetical protein
MLNTQQFPAKPCLPLIEELPKRIKVYQRNSELTQMATSTGRLKSSVMGTDTTIEDLDEKYSQLKIVRRNKNDLIFSRTRSHMSNDKIIDRG